MDHDKLSFHASLKCELSQFVPRKVKIENFNAIMICECLLSFEKTIMAAKPEISNVSIVF